MAQGSNLDTQALDPGAVVAGRYVIEEQVAEGGMATIYRARDRQVEREVALKVLYSYYSRNAVVCTRFLDEGRIQRYLAHPNIIDVFDIVDSPPLAIVMEYIRGPTLEEYLEERGSLSGADLLSVMLPVLSAIGFAHKQGIIHRDLKPSNILLEEGVGGFVPKVMDFGVAKMSRDQELTADGTTVGTLHYMSPEQVVGSRQIDGRADIYSLGVTMYKLCTGEVPFNASTEFALMMAQVEAEPLPPSELRAGLAPQLEAIILRALAKRPGERFQSVRELTAALLKLREETPEVDLEETLSAPLPADLLRYAMMADEVAQDRTRELEITAQHHPWELDGLSDDLPTQERARPAPTIEIEEDEDTSTLQLDRARLRARMDADRQKPDPAERPMSGEDLMPAHYDNFGTKHTRPLERETTRQRDAPDSRALTRPFDRPLLDSDKTHELTRPAAEKSPARRSSSRRRGRSSEKRSLKTPASAQRQRIVEPIPQRTRPASGRQPPSEGQAPRQRAPRAREEQQRPRREWGQDALIQDDLGSSGDQASLADSPLMVGEPAGDNPVERIQLRARASGEQSKTDVSRGDIREGFRQIRAQEAAASSTRKSRDTSRLFIALCVIIIIGISLALAWYLI